MPRKLLKPPYAVPSQLEEFFRKVPTVSGSIDRVDRRYIQELGLSRGRGNEGRLVSALKFLGLIAPDGKPTPSFNCLRLKAEERRKELEALVRDAYSPVLAGLDLARASLAELHNGLVRQYDVGGDIADKAVGCFLVLCRLAGMPLSPELRRAAEKASGGRGVEEGRRRGPARPAEQEWPFGGWALALPLSPDMTEDEMVRFLLKVRQALRRVREAL